jgi:hypothetical protein
VKLLKGQHPAALIALVAFAVMAVCCYLRLFIGVGLGGMQDEYHWVGSAALSSIGGRPFINDRYIQQLCGLTYEPLVFLYYKLFGHTGVLLFVRHLYFALSVFGAYVFYRFYRPKTDVVIALSIAALPLVGTFWGSPSLGYNAIGGICFGTGSLLALNGLDRGNRKWLIASAVLFAWALAAYPTLLLALITLWTVILIFRLSMKKPVFKELILANTITASLVGAFLLMHVYRAGWENVAFSYAFSTAQQSLGSFTDKIYYGGWLMLAFWPPLEFVIPAFLLWAVLWKFRGVPWIAFAIPMTLWIALKEPPEPGTFHPPLFMLLAASGAPMMWRAIRKDLEANWIEVALWATALVSTLFPWWSSMLTIYVTFVTSTYCLPPIFALARTWKTSIWLSLVTMVIPVTIFVHKIVQTGQFDEGSLGIELEMMTEGPFAGLVTSPQRAAYFTQMLRDIETVRSGASSILFYDEFPLGFLMSDLYPATPTVFMHGLRESFQVRPWYRQLYSDPLMQPDVIFRFNWFPIEGDRVSVHPDKFKPYEDPFWHFLPEESGLYEKVLDRDSYEVFKRKTTR